MNTLSLFKQIKVLIFDVDGVLTNSQLLILEDGSLLRQMNTRDGYAIKQALEEGLEVFIITGGKSTGVLKRLEGLGIPKRCIYAGIQRKIEVWEELTAHYQWKPETVLYMGDDFPDYEVMQQVGMACCPSDAVHEIKALCKYISPIKGGEGCVRDVIEKVIKLKT